MPCFLIDPTQKTITAVEGGGDLPGVRALIGFETVDSDEIDANGDRLYFDEKCFIRQTPGVGRFQLDSLAPVAGMGVVKKQFFPNSDRNTVNQRTGKPQVSAQYF